MSFIPDKEEYVNSFQIPHAPPIRKLFSSVNSEDGKSNATSNDTFKVFLRIKPNSELNNSQNDCISIHDNNTLVCKPPRSSKLKKLEKVEYTFSHIFGPKTTQFEIFSNCVANCVEDLLLARNSLIFTYGTTNAGKTFTVQGSVKSPGIIPQVLHTLFCNIRVDQNVQFKPYLAKDILKVESATSQRELLIKNEILRTFRNSTKSSKSSSLNNDSSQFMQALQRNVVDLKGSKPTCSVWISFLEVYNETIYDLLDSAVTARKPLKLAADHSDNFYVKGLKQVYVGNAEEAFAIYQYGKRNLNIASTKINENSSRSHCIFTIHIINLDDDDQPAISKLCICDLAGTERLTKTQNTGIRLKESGNINGSLFQLNRCLRAIRENQTRHTNQLIPYRHSNLTKLLHSALDDRTDEKSIMIVNINPAAELFDETQQVLKMCAIASKIRNKPITKKPQSTRFSTFIYGRETASMDEDRNQLSDFEETDDVYIQDLNEKLLHQEEEINRLKEHVKIRENYHENTKKNLKDYCEKIETTYKSRVKSLEERLKSQKEYYLWKITDVKKNMTLESISDEAIREELSRKEASIAELEKKLSELQWEDTYKNPSSPFSRSVQEELLKKDAQIEALEKKVLELQHDDHCTNLSSLDEIHEKDIKIKELESLILEVKEEYLSLEKKYMSENAKMNELEIELTDKNEMIEHFENQINGKQNIIEELEQKIECLEEKLNQNAIEHEEILFQIEKSRDKELAALKNKIEKLNELCMDRSRELAARESDIAQLNEKLVKFEADIIQQEKLVAREQQIEEMSQKLNQLHIDRNRELAAREIQTDELNEEFIKFQEAKAKEKELVAQKNQIEALNSKLDELDVDWNRKLAARENQVEKLSENVIKLRVALESKSVSQKVECDELRNDELVNTKRYNTRRNNKTPSGKENRLIPKCTPIEVGTKSSRKVRGKAKTPLCNLALDDSLESNIFRNIPEKDATLFNLNNPPKSEKKKLFSSPASSNPYNVFPESENKSLLSYPPSPGLHARDYEPSKDTNRFVQMATPLQTVKSMKKKK